MASYKRKDYTQISVNIKSKEKLLKLSKKDKRSMSKTVKILVNQFNENYILSSHIRTMPEFENENLSPIRVNKSVLPQLKKIADLQSRPMYQMLDIIINEIYDSMA